MISRRCGTWLRSHILLGQLYLGYPWAATYDPVPSEEHLFHVSLNRGCRECRWGCSDLCCPWGVVSNHLHQFSSFWPQGFIDGPEDIIMYFMPWCVRTASWPLIASLCATFPCPLLYGHLIPVKIGEARTQGFQRDVKVMSFLQRNYSVNSARAGLCLVPHFIRDHFMDQWKSSQ